MGRDSFGLENSDHRLDSMGFSYVEDPRAKKEFQALITHGLSEEHIDEAAVFVGITASLIRRGPNFKYWKLLLLHRKRCPWVTSRQALLDRRVSSGVTGVIFLLLLHNGLPPINVARAPFRAFCLRAGAAVAHPTSRAPTRRREPLSLASVGPTKRCRRPRRRRDLLGGVS